jgi:hypothetical protein
MQVTKKTIYEVEDFDLTFEPINDTISIEKIKTGFELRYLTPDNDPTNPREDENLGNMVCFHNRYSLGDKSELNSDMFNSWQELYSYLIKEKNAITILPLYLYDHSGISIKVGSFRGLLPQGHAEFDSGQVGFIYTTKEDLKRIGVTKAKADKSLREEVEHYNRYLRGDIYFIVRETFDHNKEQVDYDICGGYYGMDYAEKALKTDI